MKRKIVSLSLFLLICIGIHAQKEAYNWTFGGGSGLSWENPKKFTGTITQLYGYTSSISNVLLPTTFQNSINTYEGCFALSDPQTGKLLFYSDGITLYNADGTVMTNGDKLGGDPSSAQSGVLMPYPGGKNIGKFIAISIKDGVSVNNYAQYAIIDTNGGTNKVISKNNGLNNAWGRLGESVNVIRNANKKDFWIVVPGSGLITGTTNYRAHLNIWKVTEDGIEATPTRTAIPFQVDLGSGNGGGNRYFKFSPDGKYFVWALNSAVGVSFVYGKFDAETGTFSDIKSYDVGSSYPMGIYGVEFSKSGRALYLSRGSYLFAFEFQSLLNSPGTYKPRAYEFYYGDATSYNDKTLSIGAIQLAPDGYIYGTWYDSHYQPAAGTGQAQGALNGTRRHMVVITNPENPSSLNIYRLDNFLLGNGGHIGITSFSPSWFAIQIQGPQILCSTANGASGTYSVNMSGSDQASFLRWYWDANSSAYEEQEIKSSIMSKYHTFPPTSTVKTHKIKIEGRTGASQELIFTDTYEVTVYPSPTATATTLDACVGNTVTLSPTSVSDGAEVKWYTTATGGTPLASSGTNTAISNVLTYAGYVYYYMEVSNPACSGSARIPVMINVGAGSTPQLSNPSPICSGSTTTLQVTGATGATVKWYATSTSTTVLGTGATFVTPALNTTTSYFAEITGSSCINVAGRLQAVVTVNALPTVTKTDPPSFCAGNSITLTATPSAGATLRWYRNFTDVTPVATGNSCTTEVLNASTSYFVEAYNATTGCTSERKAVSLQVFPLPTFTVTPPSAVCVGNTTTLTATPLYGATISWYKNIGDVTPVATGNTYTTGILYGNTTFYVEASEPILGCTSARQAVNVIVYAPPSITVSAPAICYGEKAVLTATVGSNVDVLWYINAGDSTPFATGSFYTSPIGLTGDKTYYVEAVNTVTGCVSARKAVKVVIKDCSLPVNPHIRSSYE